MAQTKVAAMQIASTADYDTNMATAERVIRAAAADGAQIILPNEVFSSHEFQFMEMGPEVFKLAEGCWQTNSIQSPQGQRYYPLIRAEATPLCECSGAVEFEIGSS